MRLPEDLYAELEQIAKEEERSTSYLARRAVELLVEQWRQTGQIPKASRFSEATVRPMRRVAATAREKRRKA